MSDPIGNKENESQSGTRTNTYTMEDAGASDVIRDVHNVHAHAILMFQLACAPAGNFSFSASIDGTNFIPIRVWDAANLTHTTTASLITRAYYSCNMSGQHTLRIVKSGVPNNTTATLLLRRHRHVGAHELRTKH